MDELVLRTTQLRAQSIKLKQAKTKIDELKFEQENMKSCIGDVNSLLFNLIEAHDPILTITIHRNLADKLHPALTLMKRLEGVSEALVPPKQGVKIKLLRQGKKQSKTY